MIHRISDKIAQWLLSQGSIPEEDCAVYTYGLELGIAQIVNFLTAILIGTAFGMVLESVLFLTAYIPLRSYAGGYHAGSELKCYVLSCVQIVLALLTIRLIPTPFCLVAAIGLALVSIPLIFILAPIPDSRRSLDLEERLHFRKRALLILFCESMFGLLFYVFQLQRFFLIVAVVFFHVAVVLGVGSLKNRKMRKGDVE